MAAATSVSTITINSEEINLLIYSYFLDCGFKHSAFTICQEGHLEHSSKFKKHIPRGELAELLSKSLLYSEVESHYRGGEAVAQCRASFSLLERHVCTSTPSSDDVVSISSAITVPKPIPQPTKVETKRKATPISRPEDKRQKTSDKGKQPESVSTVGRGKASLPVAPQDKFYKPSDVNKLIEDGYGVRRLEGHDIEVFVCSLHPTDSSIVASGSKNCNLIIWKTPNPLDSQTLQEPIQRKNFRFWPPAQQGVDLTCLSWNPTGTLVAMACFDGSLRLCTFDDTYAKFQDHEGPIFATRFSPDGRHVVSASLDGATCVYDVQTKTLKRKIKAHSNCVLETVWLNDTSIATCGADTMIYITDIEATDKPSILLAGHKNEVNMIRMNPAGTKLASCSDDMTCRIWNITNLAKQADDSIPGLSATDKVIVMTGHERPVTSIAWCENEKHSLLVTGSFDTTTRVWDTNTGQCIRVIREFTKPVYSVMTSPDGDWYSIGGAEGLVRVFNVEDEKKNWTWRGEITRQGIFDIDWRSWDDGKEYMSVAFEDNAVLVFDVTKLKSVLNGQAIIQP